MIKTELSLFSNLVILKITKNSTSNVLSITLMCDPLPLPQAAS